MRKKYFLLWLLSAVFTITSYAQTPVITHVVDACGNNGKFVEIYASGSVDFSDFKLVRRSNAGTWADNGVDIDLSSFGTKTDEFIYVIRDLATMNAEFPSTTITDANSIINGDVSHNGDDSYRLVQITGDVVIDQFGGDIDGTGEEWEYEDSWGARNNNEGPNPVFTFSEWTFGAVNALDDAGLCNSFTALEDTVTTLASYEVASSSDCGFAGTFDYADNSDISSLQSFSVDTPGDFITLNFTEGSTESCCDDWFIFDTADGSGTPIASGAGSIVGEYTSTTGEISFYVDSDGSLQGTTFVFNVVCSSPPSCLPPSNLIASLNTISSVELAWDAIGNVADTDAYTWFVFEEGQNPETDTPTATGSTNETNALVDGLTSSTAYQAYVQANCGVDDGLSELSDALSFSTLADFCGGDLFYDNGGQSNNYSNNANETTTISPDNAGDVVFVTFLSFNTEQNWDGLLIYDGPDTSAPLIDSGFVPTGGALSAGAWHGSPTQDFTANGETFVSSHPSGALTFVFTSDGSGTRAGWEASVVCGPPPSCNAPENLTIDSITSDEAQLSWDAVDNVADTDAYTWFVFEEGQDPEIDTPLATGTTDLLTATVSGLSGNTVYDAYVSANCGADGVSDLSSLTSFTTECDAFLAPFTENFDDNGTSVPECWSRSSTAGQWQVNTTPTFGNTYTDNTTGSGSFAFVDGSTFNGAANDITLTTPFVDVSGLTIPALEFFVHHFKSQGATDNSITVEVWDGAAWNQVYFDNEANFDGWEQVIVDLSTLTITGDVQARFIVDNTPNNFYNDIALDDVSFEEGPTCFPVTSLATSNLTGTGLDFSWDAVTTALTGYEWAIVEFGVGDIADDTTWVDSGSTDAATTTASSSLLNPETEYELYVRSNCGVDDFSEYNSVTFTTTVICPEASDLVLAGVTNTEANFSWSVAISETGGYEYVVLADGLDPVADFDSNVANGTTLAGETTQLVSGLEGNTDYEFHLRAVCDSGELSEFISISFTTDCDSATLNYEQDFTGLTTNVNTSLDCWTEGTGFFDTVSTTSAWGGQNFNNDIPAGPFGTSLYINLYNSSTGIAQNWVKSQSIDLGAGSADNVISYDVYVRPWTINETTPVPVTDMGTHSVQVVISEDGGLTWDLANTIATYDNNNIPSDLVNTQEEISLAAYSGVIQIGFYALRETTTPDLRFYIDNLFVGVPPTCDSPVDLSVETVDSTTVDLSWAAVDNATDTDAYTWYVFEDGADPLLATPVATGTTNDTFVTVSDLEFEVDYQAYVEVNCGADGTSELSDALDFFIGYCIPISLSNIGQDYISLFETTNALSNVNITAIAESPEDYRNLTASEIVEAFAGQEVDFNLTYADTFGSTQIQLWVDWNNNLNFEDDESLFQLHSGNNEKSGTFTVPSDIANGQYRMRVRAEWTTTDSGGPTACDDITYGETIDLTIEVTDEPAPVFANVQVIHNSPDPAAASVDVYLDGQLLPALTGVNFRTASEFLLAPAGVDFTVDVVPAGADLSASVFTQTFNLAEDENYIIVANGVLTPADFITDNGFELSVYTGAQTAAVDPTQVDVLVHHGSPDAPAVDVNESSAGNLVPNISYPEFQGYLELPPADYTIEIAAAGTPDALVSYSAPLATLGGFEGQAITIIASGFFGDDAGDDNGFGLWVATATGGPLLELPLVENEPAPMEPAPDPTEEPEDVISLYSGVYTNVPVDTWLTPWSSAQLADIQIQGNDTKLYTSLDFAGIETVANPIDATDMDFFHMDVWSPNATTFRVKLVDLGAGAVEGEIAFALPQEEWVSLQIPLNDFADADLVTDPNNLLTVRNSIQQLIISGLPVGQVTAYVDNVYFSKEPLSSVQFDSANFTYYPNPVSNKLRIDSRNVVEQVEVFNMLGQRVISQRFNQTNPVLDAAHLEAGVYLMKVSIDGTDKTFQIIKN